MAVSRGLFGLAVSMGLSAVAIQAGAAETPSAVVAEINGQKLTRADLEQRQAAKLLQARYQHYLAERDALDEVVNERLVELQARTEHLSVEQLLQREVTSKAKEPTEDQLEVFYEGLKIDRPFAEVREQIVANIRQNRLAKARAAYLQALRSQASVTVALAPPEAELAPDDAPRRGPHDAPVVVVEFADYECPHCQRIHPELKKLQNEFGDRLAFAFKDFPLPMHPRAEKAAEAARCAGAQGRFWDFQDRLFDGTHRFEPAQLKEYARGLKLDAARFNHCLDAGEQTAAVKRDLAQAQRLGLTGTPSFFINGHFLSGAVKYSTLREIVEQQLVALRTSGNEVALR
jgi:protein-disulfide isomerase